MVSYIYIDQPLFRLVCPIACVARRGFFRCQLIMEAQPKTKNTRLGLSLAERIQVIEARQIGKSMRQLAAQFGCGKTQILNTLAQKDRYIQEWELLGGRNNPVLGARKRFRHTRNEEINRSVYQWYQQQNSNGQSVTGPMLQRQARQYANDLGIMTFAASNGWLANFRRFYNIVRNQFFRQLLFVWKELACLKM